MIEPRYQWYSLLFTNWLPASSACSPDHRRQSTQQPRSGGTYIDLSTGYVGGEGGWAHALELLGGGPGCFGNRKDPLGALQASDMWLFQPPETGDKVDPSYILKVAAGGPSKFASTSNRFRLSSGAR